MFCGHKPLLCFFVFILSPSLAFWHSSSIPTVPTLHPVTHAHMQVHSFGSGWLFFFFFLYKFCKRQFPKSKNRLPGPSSAPYLIIFERKAGWGWCQTGCCWSNSFNPVLRWSHDLFLLLRNKHDFLTFRHHFLFVDQSEEKCFYFQFCKFS